MRQRRAQAVRVGGAGMTVLCWGEHSGRVDSVKNTLQTILAVFVVLAAGCGSNSEAPDSTTVQQAIERYLSGRTNLNMSSMELVVEHVSYDGDRATAEVTISARENPEAKMEKVYQLRKVDSGWEVEPSAEGESSPHGGAMTEPGAGGMEMPPGHPPGEGPSGNTGGELPPGHPPVAQ